MGKIRRYWVFMLLLLEEAVWMVVTRGAGSALCFVCVNSALKISHEVKGPEDVWCSVNEFQAFR